MIRLNATRHLVPPERKRSTEWLESEITMPAGTETGGMPFSIDQYPHVAGVLDAFDDPRVRTIVLQWGTRLGKTTTCLSLMAKIAATHPRNMMLASPNKEAAGKVVSGRLYPILDSCRALREQMPPSHRRSMFSVRFDACRIYVGWSGSESSLADVGAWFGVGSEIDKWDMSASNEADSLQLFLNRFKGFPDHKILLESTPTIKGRSRIEYWMNQSKQHQRWVPCPFCGEYQVLIAGTEDSPGGVKWERLPNGQSEANLAFATAYYQCLHCHGKIENHHRVPMLRQGVWCPVGCKVGHDGAVTGTPAKDISDVLGFGPLPSWYSLTETWGSFARRWVASRGRPKDRQDVFNSYMAEAYEIRRSKSTREQIAERINGKFPRGLVPMGGLFVTVAIDRQAAAGGFVVFVVLAHGEHDQTWVIDYGTCKTLDDVYSEVFNRAYPHEDGEGSLAPCYAICDSGYATKETYEFCRSHSEVIPCKGSSSDLGMAPYAFSDPTERKRRSGEQIDNLCIVNTNLWEAELQQALDERAPGDEGAIVLCREAAEDLDFLTQLLNGIQTDRLDTRGNPTLAWVKKDLSTPNDFRDAVRYGLCLAAIIVKEQDGQYPARKAVPVSKSAHIVSGGDTRPDGRSWL